MGDRRVVTPEQIQRVIADAPAPPETPHKATTASTRRNGGTFDLEGFMAQHGIEHGGAMAYGDGVKYQLAECPFDPSHKSPDSVLYQSASGALGFKCSHDSCRDRDWQELRERFDPGVYDRAIKSKSNGELMPQGAETPTEDDLALSFVRHRADLQYVAAWNKWMHFDGGKWLEDGTLFAYDLIRAHIRAIAETVDKDTTIRKAQTVAAVEKLAKADRAYAGTVDQWDQDKWTLNTPAGVVDLETGRMGPHDPDLYQTKQTAVSPAGECPQWKEFLTTIMDGDQDLIGFLQRVSGYCLTGSTREHALFFDYGTGSNGKGVFLNTLAKIWNDYAQTASMDVFIESHGDRHPTELARLRGARLVIAQETDTGRSWNESLIKSLTGGDRIAARFMRQDFFEYDPAFKLVIAGNHKPQLKKVDEAMRRRLHLVPFAVTIPKPDRDPELQDKLTAEWPGILQWCIDGCLAYRREGLRPPKAVTDATAAYFESQDLFSQWIEDKCIKGANEWDGSTPLFASWKQYADAAGIRPGTSKTFKDAMEVAGFEAARNSDKTSRGFNGLALKPEPAARDPRDPGAWDE